VQTTSLSGGFAQRDTNWASFLKARSETAYGEVACGFPIAIMIVRGLSRVSCGPNRQPGISKAALPHQERDSLAQKFFMAPYGLGKATMDAMLHSVQSRLSFPSWTSRVRSPSPAFRFIDLQACRFRKYTKYSVNEVVRAWTSLCSDASLLQTKALVPRFERLFVTSSLGSR
jgi:hypothetical protein